MWVFVPLWVVKVISESLIDFDESVLGLGCETVAVHQNSLRRLVYWVSGVASKALLRGQL